ncbi:MAG: glycoside hydrolase family 3 C-terminal domain-containing protein [Lachnospiraceae bacterium]|nr:glycoside hydrolase family 3 C-terminal domain-containing protein [Lachnospiraceae bacterium]
MKKGFIWKILTPVFAVLLAVLIAAIPITGMFENAINVALGAKTQEIIPEEGAKIYFWSEYENEEDLVAFEKQLCRDIESEGAALLINRDHTLPLAAGTKFTPFSQSSFNLLYGGTGSGQVSSDDAVSLKSAFDTVFGENAVNPDQWKFYATCGYKRVNAATTGGNQGQYRINEVPWEKYTDALKNTWKNYGDVALVVLARSGGEGADLPSGLEELKPYMTDGDYLKLCKEELDMFENLQKLKADGTFKKIVVLLNSSNTLQLDFVDKYGIDAVLWIGDVGMTGIYGVADILAGNVNPSGRIVDTFLKDNHSSPAMQNFGAYRWTNGADYGVATAQNNTDPGIDKCNRDYVVYQEGIYVGYRYYETRYEDYVLNRGNAGNYSYDADVAFPFGYGLSYTEFQYSNFSIQEKADAFTVKVDVKNTGSVDGKHTVQIYFQSPYTKYDIDNQVEKASVELCGFDKKMIRAGETAHFTIEVRKEDLTSYDHMNAKTYILEDGDYYFTVGTDAHNAVNNILAAKGADASRMSGTGDAALTAKWTNGTFDKTTYAVSSATGKAITNRFENADLNKYAGNGGQTVTYLTRNDWTGTWPQTQVLRITEQMWADGLTHEESGRQAIVDRMKSELYPSATMPSVGVAGTLNAADFCEAEADDPRWADLVSIIPYNEMTNLVYNGFHLTQPVPSINLPGTNDKNGPHGVTKSLVGGASAMAYTSEDVMAATYNLELIHHMGKCIGEDFLHATDGSGTVFSGIYGPGANIHRTPYCGRNFEYYSEDGWLSGVVSAVEVAAIQDRGVYVFTKHFALNDQEEGRYGIATWSNEQAIRELYLEGFEGSIVKGGGMGVMSSFNRLGVVWSGAHYGLMTGILRDEWGMKGAAITDCSVFAKYMDYRFGVLAGQDLWDGHGSGMATLDGLQNDPAIVTAVQRAVKNICYSITHSHAMNVGHATIRVITPWWKVALFAACGVFAVLTALSAFMLIRSRKKND